MGNKVNNNNNENNNSNYNNSNIIIKKIIMIIIETAVIISHLANTILTNDLDYTSKIQNETPKKTLSKVKRLCRGNLTFLIEDAIYQPFSISM